MFAHRIEADDFALDSGGSFSWYQPLTLVSVDFLIDFERIKKDDRIRFTYTLIEAKKARKGDRLT